MKDKSIEDLLAKLMETCGLGAIPYHLSQFMAIKCKMQKETIFIFLTGRKGTLPIGTAFQIRSAVRREISLEGFMQLIQRMFLIENPN